MSVATKLLAMLMVATSLVSLSTQVPHPQDDFYTYCSQQGLVYNPQTVNCENSSPPSSSSYPGGYNYAAYGGYGYVSVPENCTEGETLDTNDNKCKKIVAKSYKISDFFDSLS